MHKTREPSEHTQYAHETVSKNVNFIESINHFNVQQHWTGLSNKQIRFAEMIAFATDYTKCLLIYNKLYLHIP